MDYATTKKELLTVLFAFNIFWSCRIVSNMIVYIDYEALNFGYQKGCKIKTISLGIAFSRIWLKDWGKEWMW